MDKIEALLEFVRVLDFHSTPTASEKLRLYNPDSIKDYTEAGLILLGEVMPRELESREDIIFTVKGDIRFPIGRINGTLDNGVLLVDTDFQGNELPMQRSRQEYQATVAVRSFATMEFGDLYEGDMELPKRVLEIPITTGMATVYVLTSDHQHYRNKTTSQWTQLTSASRIHQPSLEHSLSV